MYVFRSVLNFCWHSYDFAKTVMSFKRIFRLQQRYITFFSFFLFFLLQYRLFKFVVFIDIKVILSVQSYIHTRLLNINRIEEMVWDSFDLWLQIYCEIYLTHFYWKLWEQQPIPLHNKRSTVDTAFSNEYQVWLRFGWAEIKRWRKKKTQCVAET